MDILLRTVSDETQTYLVRQLTFGETPVSSGRRIYQSPVELNVTATLRFVPVGREHAETRSARYRVIVFCSRKQRTPPARVSAWVVSNFARNRT